MHGGDEFHSSKAEQRISYSTRFKLLGNRIGWVMVSVFPSSTIDRGIEPRLV